MSNLTYQENTPAASPLHFEINNLTSKRTSIIFLALISRLFTAATSALGPMKRLLAFDLPLMRSVGRLGAMGLLLALAVTLGSREVASAATLRTINLNTGYDQLNDLLIPVGQQDNEWRVTSPPLNGDAAFVMDDGPWANQTPNFLKSRWISINTTATPISFPPSSYTYEFYFTLPPGVAAPQLTMKLSSDDRITSVTLNGCILPGPPGGPFTGLPLIIPSAAVTCFKSGPNVNVITVTVEDVFGVLTSLIVEGAVTYEDCDRLPIRKIPHVSSITFFESTFVPTNTFTFNIAPFLDARLTTKKSSLGPGPGQSDFQGVPNAEFYDVFFSAWDGTVDPNGQFVTIEAVWDLGAPSGGGLNIAAVRLNSINGNILADSVSSFVALGNNAIPLNVGRAVDISTMTDTTMGNTIGQTKQRLRVTVGFPCPCTPAPSGMVAWWPLDGLDLNGEYGDLAGGDNNGIPMGSPSPILGEYVGNSIQAGNTEHVEVSDAPNLNFGQGSFTIDAWVKFAAGTTQTEPIIYKLTSPTGSADGYFLYISSPTGPNPRRLQLQVGNDLYVGPIITIPQGKWIFVAATVDKANQMVTLHVGVPGDIHTLVSMHLPGASSASSPGIPLWIGKSGPVPLVTIGIDEVEIFNRALSNPEIQSIFKAQTSGKCKVVRAIR